MKIKRKLRYIVSIFNFLKFRVLEFLLGFDFANNYLKRLDKSSLKFILTKKGASIGSNSDIEAGLTLHNCLDYSNLIIGDNCHIGKNCFFDLKEKVVLKNNVTVSMNCSFITHTDMGKSATSSKYPKISNPILIGNDCYIGTNTVILMGVTITDSTIIGAFTLVNKSIIKESVYAGIPAKELKTGNQ